MNVAFYTLGCKVNQYETQALLEEFVRQGFTPVTDTDKADVLVVNSCTVTAESDRKTRKTVRHYRKKYPQAVIVLMGCMSQAFPETAQNLTEADIVVGNTEQSAIVSAVKNFLNNGERIFSVEKHTPDEKFSTPCTTDFAEHTRAFIKIEDGCERYCTYCIIPTARGRVRSKSLEDIKTEAENLAAAGFREIVLVGINLSAFGKGTQYNLCDAVEIVCGVSGISRVRLGSLEPDHISDEMLKRLSEQEKFCPQFHLSLQSGCDETLKRMNRHYDGAFFADLVKRIRRQFENAAITTDVMVGFAGETDEEFRKSLDFVKSINFAKAHVFAYSRRAGTIADRMENQVAESEKQRRSREMIAATLQCEHNFLRSQCGKTVSVLFETANGNFYEGYTENYTRVKVQSDTDICDKLLDVEIIDVDNECCIGKLK